MARSIPSKIFQSITSLLIVEGYTEEAFYPIIKENYLSGIRVKIENIEGQTNINKKILAKIFTFFHDYPEKSFRAYCCLDTERNNNYITPLDLDLIRKKAREKAIYNLLSVDKILADREIESWFFYDLPGICSYLGIDEGSIKPETFRPVNKFGKKELKNLFREHGHWYRPGKRATGFIRSLDIDRIISQCDELRLGIERIRQYASDRTEHLY